MTGAETLRTAAKVMRERAENARAGRWFNVDNEVRADWTIVREVAVCEGSIPQGNRANAQYIASMHPAVALAVAKAIDDVAHAWEIADEANDGYVYDADDNHYRFEETVDGGWLAVANAYLTTTQEPT